MAPSQRATAADQPATFTYAGLQLRVVAFLLDIMVLISFGMLFGAGTGAYLVVDSHLNDGNLSDRAPYVAVAVFLAYVLAFLPLYHILLWSWWGQTIGKMAVHIKILAPPYASWVTQLRWRRYSWVSSSLCSIASTGRSTTAWPTRWW
jgi:uncharacterized RDD family membrane protein YckC